MTRQLLLFFLFVCSFFHTTANDIIISELPKQAQLPSAKVNCILQDSEGYMWFGTDGGLCRYDGYNIKVFRSDFSTPNILINNTITTIAEDKYNRIWFGTKRGTYILDKKNYQITQLNDNETKQWSIHKITITSDGSVWIAANKMVLRYNRHQERIGTYQVEWEGDPKDTDSFYEDRENGTLWMTQRKGGLFSFDSKNNCFTPYRWPYKEWPTSIIKAQIGDFYWVGSGGKGIIRFDPSQKDMDKMFIPQLATIDENNSLQGSIVNMYIDNKKNYLWAISTDNLYAYKVSENGRLKKIETSNFLNTEKKILNHITSDHSGNLWISADYPNSFIISFKDKIIKYFDLSVIKQKFGFLPNISLLMYDDGFFWLWDKRGGLMLYNPINNSAEVSTFWRQKISPFFEKSINKGLFCVQNGQTILHLFHKEGKIYRNEVVKIEKYAKNGEHIRTLYEDKFGNIWIGTSNDLLRYNIKTKQLDNVWKGTGIIQDIVISNYGDVFCITENNKLLYISNKGERREFPVNETCSVITIFPNQDIWLGTKQGNILRFDFKKGEFESMGEECGLNGDAIINIDFDNSGNIWILTNKRIITFNHVKKYSEFIIAPDPNISMYSFNCMYKNHKGTLYVGGIGGFFSCPNLNFQDYTTAKEVSLKLSDVVIDKIPVILKNENKTITLKSFEQSLELFFSTFDPLNSEKIRYSFRYKGDKDNWNYIPQGSNSIYLTKLSKGYHTIEVKATDKDGHWGKNILTIEIYRSPQWYDTWMAYLIYLLIIIIIIYYTINSYLKRQKEKNQKKIAEQVEQMRINFFTNVSHELRTPLTLIITPLENIIRKISDVEMKIELESVEKNVNDLLTMVNQLLNIRKLEMVCEQLSLSMGDLNEVIVSIFDKFQMLANKKKITFNYNSEVSSLFISLDYDKISKIINNLLSNAFKFTEEGGKITISLEIKIIDNRNYALITVEDTGIGISENELTNIFKLFYQVSAQKENVGSGIGLHIVKEYAEMHEGSVHVKSVKGKGSFFYVYIPTDLTIDNTGESQYTINDKEDGKEDNNEEYYSFCRKKILIVDDNSEFRSYLKRELSTKYIVYEAVDGEHGVKEVLEKAPDIVISDVMMPNMNGIELCHQIKNNIEVSHIPVILLTASTNINNEIQGYKERADAYISKPFNWDILTSRIENLLNLKLEYQQEFRNNIESKPSNITISSLDEKFIEKAIKLVERNISNPEYSVEELSSDMAMSRVNLFRKLRSIIGMAPNEFIRNIRMKQAAKYILEGEMSIVEIADQVGFNTPSYFSKTFKKMFGVLPTHYKG